MIRGIYWKIFLWFCFAIFTMDAGMLLIAVLTHSQSLGARWMTGVLDIYARSAVDIYFRGGTTELAEYLDEIERSSRMRATLLDPEWHDILGRGVPPGAKDALAIAKATGRTRFVAGMRRWRGAAVVSTPKGDFVLVAQVLPFRGLLSATEWRAPLMWLLLVLTSGGLLSLVLARHLAAPIRGLQSAARRIADGDLSVRTFPVISGRKDELVDLAEDFDRMAEHIQALLQKQQELLADISHELRSPLTRLSVYLELARRGQADAVERMQTDVDRLDILIGQILTLSRLQSLNSYRSEKSINLGSILKGIAEDARFEGQEQHKSVVLTSAEDCWLMGDPTLLRSCIENVVRNAVTYTKPYTEVIVSLELVRNGNGALARVCVADHGDGVPAEALPRLFEAFYRVSGSRDRKSGGTGLGLSIAQRIAVLHGGGIVARSRKCGGLEVEISLPAVSSPHHS
ncbi:MAG: HAMP domain-containing protein [Acidobacteriaceae bacterium]|nr:HAMP domain-containing protein [Acidobacteriaceae bacterium]